jgi:hypothetical protein
VSCGKRARLSCSVKEVSLSLGVEDEDKSTTGASDDVGERSLEESLCAFVLQDSYEAVSGTSVHLVGSARVHHESSPDGIERVGEDAGSNGDDLSESPHGEDGSLLGIGEENGLAGIEATEVRSAVGDDSNDGDTETSVESSGTLLGGDGLEAVNETSELSVATLADISGETGSSEVKGVDDAKGRGTSGTTGRAVSDEELEWLRLGVVWVEDSLEEVLEGEVQGLGGEIPNDVSHVTSPQGSEALLLDDSGETVANAGVSVFLGDGLGSILNLEEELDSLDGGDDCLGDGSRETSNKEVSHERLLQFLGSGSGSGHGSVRIFNRFLFQL